MSKKTGNKTKRRKRINRRLRKETKINSVQADSGRQEYKIKKSVSIDDDHLYDESDEHL